MSNPKSVLREIQYYIMKLARDSNDKGTVLYLPMLLASALSLSADKDAVSHGIPGVVNPNE